MKMSNTSIRPDTYYRVKDPYFTTQDIAFEKLRAEIQPF